MHNCHIYFLEQPVRNYYYHPFFYERQLSLETPNSLSEIKDAGQNEDLNSVIAILFNSVWPSK